LFPNQFQPLFGANPGGGQMQFQPPWGNNGTLGSNQGPGANPGMTPMQGQQVQPMQGQQPQPMPKIGADGSSGQPSGLLNPTTLSNGAADPSYAAMQQWGAATGRDMTGSMAAHSAWEQ